MREERKAARRGRPVRLEGEKATKDRILEAAIELFAERGYEGCSMRQIAAAVGVTEGAVYRHYPSKESILEAVLAFAERSVYRPLPVEGDLGAGEGGSIFRGLLAALPRLIAGDPSIVKVMRIVFFEMRRDRRIKEFYQREFVRRADEHMEALFRRCIEAGTIRDCDPAALARVFNAFRAEWAINEFIVERDERRDAEDLERDLEAPIAFFESLLVPPASRIRAPTLTRRPARKDINPR